MPRETVAQRYANAFISLAKNAKEVDVFGEELDQFRTLLDQEDGLLRDTLCTPKFTSDERTAVLKAVLPKLKFNQLTSNFLRLLLEKRRFQMIDAVCDAFRDEANNLAGRLPVHVTTAATLEAKTKKSIQTALEAATSKQVLMECDVDPSLIGGLVARVGDRIYDSSIKARLEALNHHLRGAPVPTDS